MMRVPRGLLGRLTFGGALACALGLTGCWVVVGGEDKILVEGEEGRGGRTTKAPTQAGAGGLGAGEGGSAGTVGGAAGQGANGGAGGDAAGFGGANGGAPANGGASGAGTSGGGQGGTAVGGAGSGGTGGVGVSGNGGAAGGSSGTAGGGASAGGGMGGSASGMAGKSGAAGVGAGGSVGGVQTGPGQFDCNAQPFKSSFPFCTNFSPAPDKWETFTGCNSRPMTGGNTTLLWSRTANQQCTAFLTAGVTLMPTRATLSLWVRVKEIGLAPGEPALDFLRLDNGTHPGVSVGVRQARNALGVVTENILVVRSLKLPPEGSGGAAGAPPAPILLESTDLGPITLDKWHHVSGVLGFSGGTCIIGGSYGLTSADELGSIEHPMATSGAGDASTKVQISFSQTQFLVGPTSVEIDDLYLH